MYQLNDSLITVHGIGPKLFEQLEKAGFSTVKDLLLHLPFRYEDRSERFTIDQVKQLAHSPEKKLFTLEAIVKSSRSNFFRGRSMQSATLTDETGTITASWFNNPYIVKRLKNGETYLFSGQVGVSKKGQIFLTQPIVEDVDKESIHTNRLVPIYSNIPGLLPTVLRKLQKEIIDGVETINDSLINKENHAKNEIPYGQVRNTHLALRDDKDDMKSLSSLSTKPAHSTLSLSKALKVIHFPDEIENVIEARERFALEELVLLIQHSLKLKEDWKKDKNTAHINNIQLNIQSTIPFELTHSQKRSAQEIIGDLSLNTPMNRLLIGDVGSGKTVVAGLAMQKVVEEGYFAALVAPTQILAEQHSKTLTKFFPDIPIYLVTGKTKPNLDQPGIIVGTHAVLNVITQLQATNQLSVVSSQPSVKTQSKGQKAKSHTNGTPQDDGTQQLNNITTQQLSAIALIVFDEQHRFGVAQRSDLQHNGIHPHILTMTATPIPRSLMLTIFSHLNLSTIDELPKNRIPTKTWLIPEPKRESMYEWVREQIERGKENQVSGVRSQVSGKATGNAAQLLVTSDKMQDTNQASVVSSQSSVKLEGKRQKTKVENSETPQFPTNQPTGFQVLIVCPFINPSESEALENVAAAKEMYEQVKSKVKSQRSKVDIIVGLLHSKLKKAEKEQVIKDLFSGNIDVLVTTPIVEVGVDLPQAAAIIIEASERFGLASLHQLRGRVGRAGQQGYCLLFTNSKSSDTHKRLKKFETIHSGQELAELDLQNRGAGDLFGTQQSGFDNLKFATWTDLELIRKAKAIIDELTKEKKEYHSPLLKVTTEKKVLAN